MSGSKRSSAELDARRRRALYRSWHRGIRETDLLLGGFADAEIDRLTAPELDQYEALLAEADADILAWINGERPAPPRYDPSLIDRIRAIGATGNA